MKNFTNNFKQFTSRLSARWLIMALMLLLGTSSAWAAKLRGTLPGSDWNNGIQVNDNVGISINLDAGSTYEFKLFDDSKNKWFRDQYAGTMQRDNCTNWEFNYEGDGNTKIYADISGTYIFTFKWSNSKAYLTVTYPKQCTSCCSSDIFRVAGSSNLCGSNWNGNDDNNIMECSDDIFSKSYNITGNTSYTFKIVKNNSDWINTINSNASITNKIELKTTGGDNNVTLSENPSSNGKLTIYYDPNNGIYATFEESCIKVEKPTISITNPTKCGEKPVTAGKITINDYDPAKYNYTLKKDDTVKDIVYNDGYAITEAGSYTVTADLISGTSCGAVTSESETASIEDKTPSIGDFEITGVTEICSGTSTNLECTNVNGGTYLWNTEATTRSINTGNLTEDTNYSVTVTKLNGTCPATKTANITITVNALPSAPALNVPEGEVCAGNLILDDYIADSETNTVNWYKNSGCTEPATNPNLEPSVEKTFYAKSKDGNNCISSGYSELTLTSYALPSDFTVSVSDDEVCSGEDVTINIEGREIGVDYELENEVIPAEGITVNPTKNTTYSVIASLSECQNMTKTKESQITVNGTTITQSPEVVHPYEVVTFTAGEQATWTIYNNPSSGGSFENETYIGKTTAYITKGASQSTTFKGEAASGYVIRATVGDCSTDKSFDVVEDPNNCQ